METIEEIALRLKHQMQDPWDWRFDAVAFAKALIAEVQAQNEPVGVSMAGMAILSTNFIEETIDNTTPIQLFTFPPSTEQIEQRVIRQYYFKNNSCKAESAHDPDCICWHDEGTGPMSPLLDGTYLVPMTWRKFMKGE